MKHEAILKEREWLPRDHRVDAEFDVRVRWSDGEAEAQILNVSADGFRLRTMDPLEVGREVTIEAGRYNPVRAIICWACGHDAGGVFAEAMAL
ncbi:MAG TPA: PilZ domain-containing protein [Sphingomicrobium sp.]|nr:PilZ domain-containing protein [Sphingomicrobium sp.]